MVVAPGGDAPRRLVRAFLRMDAGSRPKPDKSHKSENGKTASFLFCFPTLCFIKKDISGFPERHNQPQRERTMWFEIFCDWDLMATRFVKASPQRITFDNMCQLSEIINRKERKIDSL